MPTNDFPIIFRGTNKKVSPIKNPRSYYAPEIPQINHNPVPQFGITGLHVEKFPMGDMKPYYGHSNNALTGLKANGATMFGRSLLGAIDLINIINEERDIARSDQPDWYREELERQKRKETGQFRREDLFDNKYKIYADGGNLKANNPNDEYVSHGYLDRYPNLIKLTDDINPIGQSLYNFSKVDSAYYTPTLDRLEKYSSNINSNQLTDIQKNNLRIFSDSLDPFQYSDEERIARPYSIPSEQQTINKVITNLTDQDITKLFSENYDDIKKMRLPGKISKAIKLAPSNASMKDLYQSVKFLNSDEGLVRFPNLYNTSERMSGVKASGFMYGGKLKLINL